MSPSSRDDDGNDPTRNETKNERLDRNWNELLQELRVTQTGIQILTDEKPLLVKASDRFARAGLILLALAVSSVALLIFDVVVDRLAGLVASSCLLALFALCWFVAPLVLLRGRSDNDS